MVVKQRKYSNSCTHGQTQPNKIFLNPKFEEDLEERLILMALTLICERSLTYRAHKAFKISQSSTPAHSKLNADQKPGLYREAETLSLLSSNE